MVLENPESFSSSRLLRQNIMIETFATNSYSALDSTLTNEFNQSLKGSGMQRFFDWLETNASESLYNFAHIFGNTFKKKLFTNQ